MPDPIDPAAAIADLAAQAALNPSKAPSIYKKLTACKNDEERLHLLDTKIAALRDEIEGKTDEVRAALLAKYSKSFTDVDPIRAITGARVRHTITLAKTAAYRIAPPSGAVAHAIDQFVAAAEDLGPVSQEEGILLAWLVEVQLLGHGEIEAQPAQDLTTLALKKKLLTLRQLPVTLVARLADECINMQTWLSLYLDANLGNS